MRRILPWVLLMFCLPATLWAQEGQDLIQHWETDKGLRVYFVPAPTLPMVDVRLIFDAGGARDGDLGGLARMTNALLADGAGDWDADTIAERFEGVGAQFSADSHRDMAVVSLRSLTEPDWLQTAVDTFATLIGSPAFDQRGLDRVRRQMLVSLQAIEQDPASIATRAFFQRVYGDHPYAALPGGTQESLNRIEREHLIEFHQRYYTARNAVLVMVGGLGLEDARKLAMQLSAALPAGERAAPLPPVPELVASETVRIPFPSEQAHIYVGQAGISRDDADFFPLLVGNHRLGGSGFTSRLMDEVRVRRGLAYSVHSQFVPMAQKGPFLMVVQTQAEQADEALEVMLETLEDFVKEGPTAEELLATQRNIVGGFPLRTASNSGILDQVGMIAFYGLPLDHLDTYTAHVEALTPEQVHEAFARRLDPQALVTVIVGGQ